MRFTDELRQLTDEAHSAAESSPFITELLNGQRSASDYGALIRQYLPIYQHLEQHVRAYGDDPIVRHFADPRLERSAAISADLTAMAAAGIAVPDEVHPSTQRFVEHLDAIAGSPVRLLAHHYLRYLGDLSGGRIIGRLVAREYAVPAEALTMWDFHGIDKPKTFKDDYRARLDEYVGNSSGRSTFIDEAIVGYRISAALFTDLTATSV